VQEGAILVGASDTKGTIADPEGIDVDALSRIKGAGRPVVDYPKGRKLPVDAVIDVECDIWIPAARPDVIREDNVGRLKTKLVLEGANIPVTVGAERMLHERGVLVIPDFIANAGGVICGAMEYRGATQSEAFRVIRDKINSNTKEVLAQVSVRACLPREAAVDLAASHAEEAMSYRRFSGM